MTTGFFWDEKCFWHAGGAYALTLPIGDYVQPLAAGGLPENPETKRRLKNLMEVSGIVKDLEMQSAKPATWSDLARVHPESFLRKFKETSDAGGGELGLRTPFLKGGFEIAALSAGLAKEALAQVLEGTLDNAYSLSRPPGHHCLPDWPNGFCLLNNIAIAIEAAIAANQATRFAVVDWDVHHGNGTEAIFYDRADVLTISIHQEHNYPLDTGDACDRGTGTGTGYNMNIPLPAGCGHETYLDVIDRIVTPALMEYAPDVIIVACGFDASAYDPIAQMLCSADTYRQMTARMMETAAKLCDGKLVLVHEGGYSEAYVPFCGHAVMEQLSGSSHTAPDPMADTLSQRQPGPRARAFQQDLVTDLAKDLLGV